MYSLFFSRCSGCYAKRTAQQSREANSVAAKKVKMFWSDCDGIFVLIVLTSIILSNKGLEKSTEGRTDDISCLTSDLRKKSNGECFSI